MTKLNIVYSLCVALVAMTVACSQNSPVSVQDSRIAGSENTTLRASGFPFPYQIDPETCARDEAVDIDRILDSLCGPRARLNRAGSLVEFSAVCQIDSEVIIVCEPKRSPAPVHCSRAVYTQNSDGLVIRIFLAQTDDGRIPPPTHPSSHGTCGSLAESLSKELHAAAARRGRRLNLSGRSDALAPTASDVPSL